MPPLLDQLTRDFAALGSSSVALREIETALEDAHTSLTEIGETIERDPDLAARLLRLANSTLFGFARRIETVPETLALIGLQQVQDLVTVSIIVERFAGVAPDRVDMTSFWRHSLACGLAAQMLAHEAQLPKPEKYLTLGLMHDLGRLLLYARTADHASQIFAHYDTHGGTLTEAERSILGFDHAELGAHLLQAWNYPTHFVQALRFHHQPLRAGPHQLEASAIHVADHLVNALQLGSSGEHRVPPLVDRAWERLNLPLAALASVVDSLDHRLADVADPFLTGSPRSPARARA